MASFPENSPSTLFAYEDSVLYSPFPFCLSPGLYGRFVFPPCSDRCRVKAVLLRPMNRQTSCGLFSSFFKTRQVQPPLFPRFRRVRNNRPYRRNMPDSSWRQTFLCDMIVGRMLSGPLPLFRVSGGLVSLILRLFLFTCIGPLGDFLFLPQVPDSDPLRFKRPSGRAQSQLTQGALSPLN